MSDAVNIESLSIEVSSNAQKAQSGIEALASSLEKLKGTAKGGAGLPSFSDKLEKLNEALNRLNGRNAAKLEKLSNALQSMKGLSGIRLPETLGEQIEALGCRVQRLDLAKLERVARALSALKGVGSVQIPAVQGIAETESPGQEPIAGSSETVSKTASVAQEANRELERTQSLLPRIRQKITGVNSSTDETAESLHKAGGAARETEGRFRRLLSSFKRIALYRAIRYVLSAITRSLKEGIGNVYQYSKAVGGTFSTSMDKLSSSMQYLKNSLGAMLSPLINAITPWVERMVDGFVDLLNLINQVIAKVSGAKTWTKALKYQKEYAEATDAAAEANQKLADSVLGIDELNILSDKSKSGSAGDAVDYSTMFTEAAFDDALDSPMGKFLTGIAEVVSAIWRNGKEVLIVFTSIFVAKTILNGVKKLSAAFPGLNLNLTNLFGGLKLSQGWVTTLTKSIMGAAGLVAGFTLAKTGAYELTNALNGRSGSLGAGIASLVGGVGLAVAGGAIIGGPIGALIGGLVGIAGALYGAAEAQVQFHYEIAKTKYYEIQGAAINDVREALTGYFNSMDFDKQAEWIGKIKDAQESYDDACKSYDAMWGSIAEKPVFDASDIEGLADAFKKLADAAKSVNDANIGSMMSSIKSGIELNITDALSNRLGNLLDKLEEAQRVLGQKFSSLSTEYQNVLTDISNHGGVATNEQKKKLSQLKSDLVKFTLSEDTSTARWNGEIEFALKGAIKAGDDKESVLANVKDFVSDRDTYIKSLKEKLYADVNTLEQLINLDKTEFGGKLGFQDSDLTALQDSYKAQIEEVERRYNEVLQQIINTYESKAVWHSGESYERIHESGIAEGFANFGTTIIGLFDSGYAERSKLAREQKELLAQLEKYKLTGYATGGFPETGEMFLARENGIPEFVGSIGRRTAVANNEQIVESVSRGVADANAEQNALLREQNELLRALLAKKTEVRIGGRTVTEAVETQTKANGYRFVPV